jgi:hypothetical protein
MAWEISWAVWYRWIPRMEEYVAAEALPAPKTIKNTRARRTKAERLHAADFGARDDLAISLLLTDARLQS